MITTASSTQTAAQTATKNHPSGCDLMSRKRPVGPYSFLVRVPAMTRQETSRFRLIAQYDRPTLRLVRLALLLTAAACAWPAAAISIDATPPRLVPSARVGIFYYPWFATPQNDGHYAHWQQGGMRPPAAVASTFYPARGVYSSADSLVVDAQMREIAAAGAGVVITSWWGRDSPEDRRLPQLLGAARRHGLAVAAHVEPYRGRTVASTEADIVYLREEGISDFYIWASVELPDAEWAGVNSRLDGVRVFANTNLAGRAAAASTVSTPTTSCSSTEACSRASASRRDAWGCCALRRSGLVTTPAGRRPTHASSPVATARATTECGGAPCAPRPTWSRSRATTSGTRARRSRRRGATGAATSRTRAPGACTAAPPRAPISIGPRVWVDRLTRR